jgi:hypothetical protein
VELVEQGIATVEDIDVGMRLGYGWTVGPFEIADLAGLDTVARVKHSLQALGENHLASSSQMIECMVAGGNLGRKVGRGFYRYSPEGKRYNGNNASSHCRLMNCQSRADRTACARLVHAIRSDGVGATLGELIKRTVLKKLTYRRFGDGVAEQGFTATHADFLQPTADDCGEVRRSTMRFSHGGIQWFYGSPRVLIMS